MRVLVCGGRNFDDRDAVFAALDGINRATPVEVVIEGGASGADRLAGCWARVREVSHWRVPANWSRDGQAGGMIRNGRMLRMCAPDLVIAFPGGDGTADMIRQARAAGVRVMSPVEATADPRQVSIFERLDAAA